VCQGIAGPRRKRELNDALPDRSQLKITVVNVYTSNRFPMLSVLYGGAVRRYGGGECVLANFLKMSSLQISELRAKMMSV
jgi:hypothetical protein